MPEGRPEKRRRGLDAADTAADTPKVPAWVGNSVSSRGSLSGAKGHVTSVGALPMALSLAGRFKVDWESSPI